MLNKFLSRRAEYWRAYRAVAADPSKGTIIPAESVRLHQTRFTLEIVRELPPVFTVFASAASAVRGEHAAAGYMLAGAEVIAGAGVLVAIALEARHLFSRRDAHADAARHETPRWNAAYLAAAAMGYVEAWHHAHVVGHFKLWSPYIVGATTSLVFARYKDGLVSRRIRKRRRTHVCVTPAGISYGAGPRRRWQALWTEVAAVEHGHGELALRLHDGRRHVLFAHHHLEGGGVLAETIAAIAAHAPHVPGAASDMTFAGQASSARGTALA